MFDPHRAFVIIGPSRSGTTLLRMSLHALPGVRCHGELLSPAVVLGFEGFAGSGMEGLARHERRGALLRAREADPVAFVRDLALDATGVGSSGFKLLLSHCARDDLGPILDFLTAETPIKVLFLWRNDELRRYVSERVLVAGGPANSLQRGKLKRQIRIRLDLDEFLREACRVRDHFRALERRFADHPVLRLTYEELRDDFAPTLARAADFLGAPAPADGVRPPLQKIGTTALADVIENFADVREDPRLATYLCREPGVSAGR